MRLSGDEQRALEETLGPYLSHPAVQQMRTYPQHGTTNTLSHCLNVARISLWLSRRLHLRVDTDSLEVVNPCPHGRSIGPERMVEVRAADLAPFE